MAVWGEKQAILCNTKAVIYSATCPGPKMYVGLTSRELKVRVRDIIVAKNAVDDSDLKPISKDFRRLHNSDPSLVKVRGIDTIWTNIRGGNVTKKLAKTESKWIWKRRTLRPLGLNENLGFTAVLEEPTHAGHLDCTVDLMHPCFHLFYELVLIVVIFSFSPHTWAKRVQSVCPINSMPHVTWRNRSLTCGDDTGAAAVSLRYRVCSFYFLAY